MGECENDWMKECENNWMIEWLNERREGLHKLKMRLFRKVVKMKLATGLSEYYGRRVHKSRVLRIKSQIISVICCNFFQQFQMCIFVVNSMLSNKNTFISLTWKIFLILWAHLKKGNIYEICRNKKFY